MFVNTLCISNFCNDNKFLFTMFHCTLSTCCKCTISVAWHVNDLTLFSFFFSSLAFVCLLFKVELNSSPKPFSPNYKECKISPVKPPVDLSKMTVTKQVTPIKSSATLSTLTPKAVTPGKSKRDDSTGLPVNAPGLLETPPESELNKTQDEPTLRPVSQRFAAWAQKTETPRTKSAVPSHQPLSAKVASFEKKFTVNTPTGKTNSCFVPKPQKQVEHFDISLVYLTKL